MAKIDRAARRALISQAAERQRRWRAPAIPRRPAVTCPNCTSLFEDREARPAGGTARVSAPAC